MTRPVLLRPECVTAAAGDVVVGLLLSQITYWSSPTATGESKLKVQRDGVYWIAKTREQWMAETGLTLKQYKRAITVLKSRHLVAVKVMRFGGLAQSHLRLVQPIAHKTPVAPEGPSGWSLRDHPNRSTYSTNREDDQIDLAQCRSRSTRARSTLDLKTLREEGRNIEIERIEVREVQKEEVQVSSKQVPWHRHGIRRGWMMKAADVLKTYQTPAKSSLQAFWKGRMATIHGGYQKPLTGKQCGQLKQLSKYLGDQTKPVIDYVLNHWWKFATQAAAAAGTSCPADPDIGFLLKHHAVAVNLLVPAAEVKKTPPPPPVQLLAPKTDEEPVHNVSSQELTALLDGLKSP